MSMAEVMQLSADRRPLKEVPYEDENLVKIEKKKTVKRRSAKAKREEIQKLLEKPQDINYEKAMQMYEEQPLEAKEVTQKDLRRLSRLKRKADSENRVIPPPAKEEPPI
jgi:hypothetical protein